MPKKESIVWQFFNKSDSDDRYKRGTCMYCGEVYVSNASRMARHLMLKCKLCPEKIKNLIKQYVADENPKLISMFNSSSGSNQIQILKKDFSKDNTSADFINYNLNEKDGTFICVYDPNECESDSNNGNEIVDDVENEECGQIPVKRKKITVTNNLNEAFNFVKGSVISPRDEFRMFGEMIEHRLRKIKDPRKLCLVKHKIETLLFETEMEELDEQSPVAASSTEHHTSEDQSTEIDQKENYLDDPIEEKITR